jgi:hypothetical protein
MFQKQLGPLGLRYLIFFGLGFGLGVAANQTLSDGSNTCRGIINLSVHCLGMKERGVALHCMSISGNTNRCLFPVSPGSRITEFIRVHSIQMSPMARIDTGS